MAAAPTVVPVSIAAPSSNLYAFASLRGGRVDPAELGAVARALEVVGLKPGDGPC